MKQLKRCLIFTIVLASFLSICLVDKFVFATGLDQDFNSESEVTISEEDTDLQDDDSMDDITTEEVIESEIETTEETTEETIVVDTYNLTLKYDDRYSFSNHPQLQGYSIVDITTDSVISCQVACGQKTAEKDTDVVMLNDGSETDIIARGVGTATIMLVSLDNIQKQAKVTVTVEPARLSLLLIAGQSNGEGICDNSGYHPENSVLCPEGQVYTTYAPSSNTSAKNVTGISSLTKCTESNASDFVAESLTASRSISGKELLYPLNALTQKGQGKTGLDSGLAYRWNQLTGDKVWVVNAAWSGTSINTWQPGGVQYDRAVAVYQNVIQTVTAELQAGHYIMGNRLLFWLQGEQDKKMDAEEYISKFRTMHDAFSRSLEENCQIEYFGIIMVRSSLGSYLNEDERYMNGPRIAQYYLGNSNADPDVYVVSNVNEQWVSDKGVSTYFNHTYPSGKLTYPLRQQASLRSLPTTVEGVHANIHYGQIGHNENGLTAAYTMYQIVTKQKSEEPLSVQWRDQKGTEITSLGLVVRTPATVVPVVTPLYRSKEVTYTVKSSDPVYRESRGEVISYENNGGKLLAIHSQKETISALSIVPKQLATPVISSVSNENGGILVKWNKVDGASLYRVYYKTDSGKWTKITDTSSNSYMWEDAKSGTTYSFTVRCISSDSKSYTSDYNTVGKRIKYIAAPTITSLTNVNGGVKIQWGKVSGATKYRVYYRIDSGNWTKIGDTTDNSYTWKGAKAGTKYTFTVRCISNDGKSYTSSYDAVGKNIQHIAAPTITSVTNVGGGVQIKWGNVTGATKYRVFYKTGSSSWQKISDTTATSYTWAGVKNGTSYTFTVRCISSDAKQYTSGYDDIGKKIQYFDLATPMITSVANINGGVQIKWSKVSGAAKYRVFYKTGSGDWKKIGDTTSTSYTWKEAKVGTTYTFTVRCISSDGKKYTSGYDEKGKIIQHYNLATPEITAVTNVNGGVQIQWGKIGGAEKYRIYYKSGTGWTKIADTTSTSYVWKDAKSGTKYTFTVRCISKDAKTYTSSYNTTGKSITYIATPKISSVSKTSSGVKISWGKVTGAAKYRVYYKTGNGSWTKIADTTSTSYTWKGAKSGTKFTFTVRCISSDGKSYTSSYDPTGKSIQ